MTWKRRVWWLGLLVMVSLSGALRGQAVDLSVTGISAPGGVTVGVPVTFSVGISASGASGVTVTAIFQPAVLFNGSGSTSGCTANPGGSVPSATVTCPATGLTAVLINVTPQQTPSLTVVAGVIGSQADSNMSNNSWPPLTVSVGGCSTPTLGPSDFNGDGKTDILWRQTSGAVLVWLMNGTTVSSSVSLPTTDPSWSIVGTADFNGDGKTDILWRNTSGAILVWLMNGTTVTSGVSLPSTDPSWSISATGDLNGDGKPDILFRHTSGAVLVWLMNGTTVSSSVSLPTTDPSWSIVGPK